MSAYFVHPESASTPLPELARDPSPPPPAPGSPPDHPQPQPSGTAVGLMPPVLALFRHSLVTDWVHPPGSEAGGSRLVHSGVWPPAQSLTQPRPLRKAGLGQQRSKGAVRCGNTGSPLLCGSHVPAPGAHAHVVGVDEGDIFAAEVLHAVIRHVHQGRLPLVLPIQPWGHRRAKSVNASQLPADLITSHMAACGPRPGRREKNVDGRDDPDPQ